MKAVEQFFKAYGIRLTLKKYREILFLLLCLEVVVAFSYLGFIQIPPISVTTLSILVIVAAMYFGPQGGIAVSLVFAFTSMWTATVTSVEIGDIIFSPIISGKPMESIVMALFTRVLFALFAGFMFKWFFSKERKHRKLGIAIISIVSTAVHALLVYICMASFFGAAETETTSAFSNSLMLNNLILYSGTVVVTLLFDYLMQSKSVKHFFEVVSADNYKLSKEQSHVSQILTVAIMLLCIFICIHLTSRTAWYFSNHENSLDNEFLTWTYSLLTQFVIGFAATVGIIVLFFRWIQEYFSALTLEANMKARENAEIASKSKSSFLFNMSHDIRTPLNAITGFTDQAIRHKDDPVMLASSLEKVKDSSAYLLNIINDILDMAKIESGKIELNEELHLAVKGSNTLLEVFGAEAARKGIEFHNSYDIKDKYFWIDENRMNQIVANLLSNAIKYTNPGGEIWYTAEQQISDRSGYGRFILQVRDTGCGMSPEFLTKVFDAFERADYAKKSGAQGTGLGMAIVKKLTDAMGGTIDIQSELGVGTTVTVTMDLRMATPEEIDAAEEKENKLNEVRNASFKGRRVLLVEDNELNREIAVDILEEEGIIVDEANDGTVAINVLKEKGPDFYDCILMDIQMPVMNGYEATKAIREMYPDKRIPIIALSANAFAEDKAASLEAGMDNHVAKPINAKELFSVLATSM